MVRKTFSPFGTNFPLMNATSSSRKSRSFLLLLSSVSLLNLATFDKFNYRICLHLQILKTELSKFCLFIIDLWFAYFRIWIFRELIGSFDALFDLKVRKYIQILTLQLLLLVFFIKKKHDFVFLGGF